ncbi:hypothetical protein [Streptomyces sp. NPDC059786]|uniref:hypothetical protein n=1 Tax=Streptomyces sp. NPDC059786 TaxID=3346946 RepID=UPI0036469549
MPEPDYALIDRLERELGIGQASEPERPMRQGRTVCLIKGCDGDTVELRTWHGVQLRRVHEH